MKMFLGSSYHTCLWSLTWMNNTFLIISRWSKQHDSEHGFHSISILTNTRNADATQLACSICHLLFGTNKFHRRRPSLNNYEALRHSNGKPLWSTIYAEAAAVNEWSSSSNILKLNSLQSGFPGPSRHLHVVHCCGFRCASGGRSFRIFCHSRRLAASYYMYSRRIIFNFYSFPSYAMLSPLRSNFSPVKISSKPQDNHSTKNSSSFWFDHAT